MDFWFEQQAVLIKNIISKKKRYLYYNIDWNNRCIGIFGARGTGKTTLMLQYIWNNYKNDNKALYISVDNPQFMRESLFDIAKKFSQSGGEVILLDEVHKYPDWSKHIKSIYDTIPDLKIVFSGSSLLKIRKQDADLSRRAITYFLNCMSMREYLYFLYDIEIEKLSLDSIVNNHIEECMKITSIIKKPLKYFREYIINGCYPFYSEQPEMYSLKLINIINEVLERDMEFICNIKAHQIYKLKKILYFLAETVPNEIKKTKLSKNSGIDRVSLNDYLISMSDARLINLVKPIAFGNKALRKVDKLLLENTNIQFAICPQADKGTLREVFFVNQVKNYLDMQNRFLPIAIEYADKGDYKVDKYIFEIGGKNKTEKQIKNIKDSFIVSDDIEVGFRNMIPLWLFGFLY